MSYVGSGCRSATWTGAVGRPAAAGPPSRRDVTIATRRQVRRPARRLPVGERGGTGGGFAHSARVEAALGAQSDDCVSPTGGRGSGSVTSMASDPRRFRCSGIEGKIGALRYARERAIPTLGLCLGPAVHDDRVGPQRRRTGPAQLAEFEPDAVQPVIATMDDQQDIVRGKGDIGGTMRLGALPGRCSSPARWSHEAYGTEQVEERHRHRYEVNNAYRDDAQSGRTGLQRLVATAGWSSSSLTANTPLLRRYPGSPRAPVPPDPTASVVPRAGRRGPYATTSFGCRSTVRATPVPAVMA